MLQQLLETKKAKARNLRRVNGKKGSVVKDEPSKENPILLAPATLPGTEPAAQAELPLATKPAALTWSDPPSNAPMAIPKPGVVMPNPPDSVDPVLVRILSWKRGHGSQGELEFMSWLHTEIKARDCKPQVMAEGCVVATVPMVDGKESTTMFSSHCDTTNSDRNGITQNINYDPTFGHIFLDKGVLGGGTCLGADDGAGVWLMLEMIAAKVPGTYVFHRGEERGGIGSHAMLTTKREWLSMFESAIAFDRADDYEVIINQGGLKCASDKFGEALAKALNDSDASFNYRTSKNGVFTDTKVYRNVIAECVNIGVGYHGQHGPDETLDYGHLARLRDVCVTLQWDALPIDRDLKIAEYETSKYPTYQGGYFGDFGSGGVYEDLGYKKKAGYNKKKADEHEKKLEKEVEDFPLEKEVENMPYHDIVDYVMDDPDGAAFLLIEMGSEIAALKAKVAYLKGALK